MKPTNEEVRAAIEVAIRALDESDLGVTGQPTDTAILRAHLETFDEEQAFLGAAAAHAADIEAKGNIPATTLNRGPMMRTYRALVAKREGK